MYTCVLAFQKRSPVFSYLNNAALIIQGVICLLFFISALISLYSFSLARPWQLRRSHRLTWIMVIFFLSDFFANIVLFGVQKEQFKDWCIGQSRQDTTYYLFTHMPYNSTFNQDTQLTFASKSPTSNLYNCTRLWEDEVKFACVLYVILFTLYVHFAFCFWRFTQERWSAYEAMLRLNMMPNEAMVPNNFSMTNNNTNTMMMNLAPKDRNKKTEEGQKSLAEMTRAFLQKTFTR
ncbi:hypothetical protein CU098_002485 [Rhizopus stolonifer]|uniref:Uncharacterized protein n=2 Tax=Mucorineae TaxID=1344963 RepID=A0A367J8Y0_RHIST|nr:hypothetical protein CU098_002485 [Rhizopus stolonifer]